MKKILFLDFEDSFTHNVVQELKRPNVEIEILHWEKFTSNLSYDLLVLGPGPGHPSDYSMLFAELEVWRQIGGKIFGVCLGHQILWTLMGAEVAPSSHPCHGQKVELTLDQDWQKWLGLPQKVRVQRYNSLAVIPLEKMEHGLHQLSHQNEIVMSRGANFLSYQFHPESVGTMCREAFFRPVFEHLL